jgi:hypothetical protein
MGHTTNATDLFTIFRVALHEDLWPDARAIGDGIGRAARMHGNEARATFKTPITVGGCLKFADDRLPV